MLLAYFIVLLIVMWCGDAYKHRLPRQLRQVAAPRLSSEESSSGSENVLSSLGSQGAAKQLEPSVGVSSIEKFLMMYTCKLCDGRNAHMVSKVAYEHGMVVTTCRHCKNRHLIADNERKLDMGPDTPAFKRVEELLRARGERVKRMQVDSKQDLLEGRYIVEQDGDNITIVDMQVALDAMERGERKSSEEEEEVVDDEILEGDQNDRRMRFITRPVNQNNPEKGPAPSNE